MTVKYTPIELIHARQHPMIQKWRASGRQGTLISNPTLSERRSRREYQEQCESYVNKMMRVIIRKERRIDGDLDLKPYEYYFKRYDVTAVECKMLRNEILNNLR